MEQKIVIDTPLGKLCACVGGDVETYPCIYTYLVRPDGVEIDLVAAEVYSETEEARAYVWGDTKTDSYTHTHTWRKEEINIEEC